MRNSVRTVLAGSVIAALSLASCSSDERRFDEPPGTLGVPDSGPEAPSSCEGRRCSRDLHAVVDGCTGDVVQACGEGEGCAKDTCVPACQAAATAEGSLGCSFWTTPPDHERDFQASCFAAFVANTWTTPATVTARFGAEPLDISRNVYRAIQTPTSLRYERIDGPIPPGEVGIVFLSQAEVGGVQSRSIRCPLGVEAAHFGVVVEPHQTSITKAFQLETNVPVSVYSVFPYGGADSHVPTATLLLPTHSWGTQYLLIDGYDASLEDPFVQIVAQEDDTVVSVNPRADVRPGIGVAGAVAGSVASWTLSRGQVLELRQPVSLAGSPIESNHPVALFGGTVCSYVPRDVPACDTLQQQIPPLHQWGSSYSAAPYKSRRPSTSAGQPVPETHLWRIVGARDGTALTWYPSRPMGAPETLSSGQFAFLRSDVPFTVRSQGSDYPFYFAQYMTGANLYGTMGDPEFVNVIPDEQFLDHYVFFVDYTYRDSTLTVVRRKDAKGFHDVTLDCAGIVS
ncbi:MAG: hypothetical protein K0S65_1978, partial [Labilithrix sp.]|nr:hypothetical protein [Labilithrix sp.]